MLSAFGRDRGADGWLAYLIYKYGFAPQEVIGFMRLIRPGTSGSGKMILHALMVLAGMVVGPQQAFMNMMFATWIRWVSSFGVSRL